MPSTSGVTTCSLVEFYQYFGAVYHVCVRGGNLKMEAVHSPKILIYFYLTARHHIPESNIPYSRCIGISKIECFIMLENAGLCVDFVLLLYIR